MTSGALRVQDLRTSLKGPFTAAFDAGSCTVIAGPSGVGKSLFLRMIADLDPNEGLVWLGDLARSALPAPRWRRLVTYVPAEPGWWGETLAEHMADPEAARRLLPDLGLDPALLAAPVLRLSTGERQRAALVRALVGRPKFLLLDEPTSALDPVAKSLVEEALGRFAREGLGLVVVSHDGDQARRIADRRLAMSADGLENAP